MRYNKGMTLGELLIVFIIMGVVAAMTIITANPQEKSLKYVYVRTLNTLGTAFYNSSSNLPSYLTSGGSASHMDGSFPTRAYEFCLMLTEYINTTAGGAANCSAAETSTIDINQDAAAIDTLLNSNSPNFIASNGVKYWMGTIGEGTDCLTGTFAASNGSGNFNVRYYIVVVDLNGDMGPNTVVWNPNRIADRVAFIVTEEAEVIPLGYPEVDVRYLTANVVYAMSSGIELEEQNTSVNMTYYNAKRTAWATATGASKIYASSGNLQSLNFYKNSTDVPGNLATVALETGPFYINYANDEVTDAQKYDFSADNNISYDSANCGSSSTFDPDACYVKIPDFY